MNIKFYGKIEELDDGRFVIVVPREDYANVRGLKGQYRDIVISS